MLNQIITFMKRIHAYTLTILFVLATVYSASAQGWCQDRKGIFNLGFGGTNAIALGPYPAYVYGSGMSLNFGAEFRVHRFIGVGFQTGLDVFFGPYWDRRPGPYYDPRVKARYASIGIPIAVKVNVHILEAANNRHADKLDVYAGLNVGGGPAFFTGPNGGTFGFLQAGPQVGVRYWFSPHAAVFGEVGWGATFANIGFSF